MPSALKVRTQNFCGFRFILDFVRTQKFEDVADRVCQRLLTTEGEVERKHHSFGPRAPLTKRESVLCDDCQLSFLISKRYINLVQTTLSTSEKQRGDKIWGGAVWRPLITGALDLNVILLPVFEQAFKRFIYIGLETKVWIQRIMAFITLYRPRTTWGSSAKVRCETFKIFT